ncbi:MAG: hypothetical protein NVSMB31_14490 [Vulcanimicrobiaceae bacterium]
MIATSEDIIRLSREAENEDLSTMLAPRVRAMTSGTICRPERNEPYPPPSMPSWLERSLDCIADFLADRIDGRGVYANPPLNKPDTIWRSR